MAYGYAIRGPMDQQAESLRRVMGDYGGGSGGAISGARAIFSQPQQQPQGGSFGQQGGAMDRFFELKTAEALQQASKRADNLSAARGMHVDGGISTQMEQELANEAIGGINQQHAGAQADLLAQQRAYAMQQQQNRQAQANWNAQMRAQQEQRNWEQQQQERLYRDMREAGTGAGGQVAPNNPFASGLPGAGTPSTGSISGGPAMGSSWDTRLGSDRGLWDKPPAPSYSPGNYETKLQAEERQLANPRSNVNSGFDYSGTKNTGGFAVPGVSPAGNPSAANLSYNPNAWGRR